MTIEDLNLSVRASNALRRAGIMTTEQLMTMSEDDLMGIRNLGQKTLWEIQRVMKTLEQKERDKVQKIAPRGSYLHGYQEGSEGMRRAVIRELTKMCRHRGATEQQMLTEACAIVKRIEVL